MTKIARLAPSSLLATLLFCNTLPALAELPFTGTWKMDLANMQQNPVKIEVANDGTYRCLTCDPPVTFKADGTDHPVSGIPGVNARSVRIVDDLTVEYTDKKDGTVINIAKISVSPDGKILNIHSTSFSSSSEEPAVSDHTAKRAGESAPGMHAISGSWLPNEKNAFITFVQTADGLKMTHSDGEHYDAKLDGKDYPDESPGREADAVMLTRIGPREIKETFKRAGKAYGTTDMTVSPDGRTMTMVFDYHGSGGTVTCYKQ